MDICEKAVQALKGAALIIGPRTDSKHSR